MLFDYSIYPITNPAQIHLLNHLQSNGITTVSVDKFVDIAADSSKLYYYINDFYNKKLVSSLVTC
jgi:hypothetical protein